MRSGESLVSPVLSNNPSALPRYTDMVNELETVGEDPNQFNEYGEAPLCVAAYKAQGMVVAELLQRETIKVNIKGKHGRTPLYIAAEEGHVFIVKCLLAHRNIDVNIKNSPGGATALMGASRRGHSRIVELLLQHPGCNPDLLDRDGQVSPLHLLHTLHYWCISDGPPARPDQQCEVEATQLYIQKPQCGQCDGS